MTVTLGGRPASVLAGDGWTVIPPRRWREGDEVGVTLNIAARLVAGSHGNAGHAAAMWGPAVLAYDEAFNPELGPATGVGFANPGAEPAVTYRAEADGSAFFHALVRSTRQPGVRPARFVLFADAGSQGSRYRVWLPAPGTELPRNPSAFAYGPETRSQPGNVDGSITDGDPTTFVVTFNNQPQETAWFAVTNAAPVAIRRVVFRHGKTFHDGGWFDTRAGKPELQVQRGAEAPWETVARLETYPPATTADAAGLTAGQAFPVDLGAAQTVTGLRVVGRPASGDNPGQAFASCAELQGLAE
jgi:hypothetical protein